MLFRVCSLYLMFDVPVSGFLAFFSCLIVFKCTLKTSDECISVGIVKIVFFNFAVQTCVDEAITTVLVIGYIIRECKLFMINSHIPDLYPCQQNIIVKSLKICVEYRIFITFFKGIKSKF